MLACINPIHNTLFLRKVQYLKKKPVTLLHTYECSFRIDKWSFFHFERLHWTRVLNNKLIRTSDLCYTSSLIQLIPLLTLLYGLNRIHSINLRDRFLSQAFKNSSLPLNAVCTPFIQVAMQCTCLHFRCYVIVFIYCNSLPSPLQWLIRLDGA